MSAQISKTENLDQLPLVIVVGGAGFLGSFLCESLLEKKLKVICLDNLTTGKKENLQKCLNNPLFTLQEKDVNNYILGGQYKPDYIFHLAGVEEYINGLDVSLETLLVNSLGTKNILDLANETGAKYLLVSTLSVYEGVLSGSSLKDDFGISKAEMQKYTHHEAKRFSEALTAEYFRKFNLNARVARVLDCYGPRISLEEGSDLNNLFKQAVENRIILIKGEGLEILHPTYVMDVVAGLEKAMFSQGTSGKIYSLVNPEEITLINFAYALQKEAGSDIKIEYLPGDNNLRFPKKIAGLNKTAEELNWQPDTALADGINSTLKYFSKTSPTFPVQNFDIGINTNPVNINDNIVNNPLEVIQKTSIDKQNISEMPIKLSDGVLHVSEKTKSAATLSLRPGEPPVEEQNNITLKPANYNNGIKTVSKETAKPSNNKIPAKKSPRALKKTILPLSVLVILIIVLFPLLRLIVLSYLGFNALSDAKKEIRFKNFSQSLDHSKNASKYFTLAREEINSLSWIFTIVKLRNNSVAFGHNLETGEKLAEIANHASIIGVNVNNLINDFSSENIKNNDQHLSAIKIELKEIDKNLSLVQALNSKDNFKCNLPRNYCSELSSFVEYIPDLRKFVQKSDKIITFLPDILGSGKEKKYLLLFQNNMELRGGGGFIGSYGLLVLNKGNISSLNIDDIYTIDGQLKGRVAPPDEILHYLGQKDYYLRDSNTSAEFPLNAKRAAWFYEKETGELVDGVVAVDLSMIGKIIDVIGPLKIPDYDKSITSKNLFIEAETNAEVNFFPGSTQKKDFLSKLGKALLDKLLMLNEDEAVSVLAKINSSIDEKHLLVYSEDQNLQTQIISAGIGGEIKSAQCFKNSACVAGDILIIDNNFGANKVNMFIDRKIYRETVIGKEGEVREKLTVNYQNNSPAETWPGGPYKNMVKVYVSKGSKLLSIDIGDERKATISALLREDIIKMVEKDEFLVIENIESEKTVWTTEIVVPVGDKKNLNLIFEYPEKLNFRGSYSTLNLLAPKQSGTINDPLIWKVGYPAFLSVSSILTDGIASSKRSDILVKPQVISYNTDLLVDRKLTVEFKKQ